MWQSGSLASGRDRFKFKTNTCHSPAPILLTLLRSFHPLIQYCTSCTHTLGPSSDHPPSLNQDTQERRWRLFSRICELEGICRVVIPASMEGRHPAITFDRHEVLTDQFQLSSQDYLRTRTLLEVPMLIADKL